MVLRAAESGEFCFDEYIFCDTGKEFDEMYEHLEKLERYLDIKITRLKARHSFDYFFSEIEKGERSHNPGQRGYSWPDARIRWCTTQLKTRVSDKYLKQFDNVVEFDGIAIDEWKKDKKCHRAQTNNRNNKRYPLCYWAMSEAECLQYCYDRGFDWGGLYEVFDRVSCFCCPLSTLDELYKMWRFYPHYWQRTKAIEAGGTYRKFRSDYSLDELETKFQLRYELEMMPVQPEAVQLALWNV